MRSWIALSALLWTAGMLYAGDPCPAVVGRLLPPLASIALEAQPAQSLGTVANKSWAFRPVVEPTVPQVRNPKFEIRNDIDRFILAKLEEKSLKPAPPAEPRVLIRRATFDLIGLPPTPEEIDEFLKEYAARPQVAYEKLIDRLLASPHYGERWGRHWLDVVRYADTAGDNSDYPIPQMYRYRNWVINAFNRDLPYDEFIRQQLAGDLLPAKDEKDRVDKLIATGYLANARRFGSYEDERYPWHLTYEDTIDNLGKAFLGLTVGCARCHDHKFDPIPQEDYYALYGFFQSTRFPRPGIELDKVQRDFVPLAAAEKVAAIEKERKDKLAEFDKRIAAFEADRTAAVKEITAAEKLADEIEKKTKIAELNKRIEGLKHKIKAVQDESEKFGKQPLPFETAYAVAEETRQGKHKPGDVCVQIKGDPDHPGKEVPRRFLTALGGQALATDAKGSGRLQLANWIADPKNPLTARVLVNRLWHYHFGRGIVPTPNNFGNLGQPPTNPELLDYLATYFVSDQSRDRKGAAWSIKKMHRLVMLSATYQQSMSPRRLDGESIRDAMLAVSGNLDRTPGGAHPFPPMSSWNYTQHAPFKAVYDTNKRSVYLMTQRIQRHPFLALFDGPDTNTSTDARITSTTPLQALFLMNDPFVHEQARALAVRLLAGKKDDEGCIEQAYLLLFGRLAAEEEKATAQEYLATARARLKGSGVKEDELARKCWESLARGLLMSNEFVYVE
jgi:hypothetical protein